jgi:hypothetical protein
MPASPIKTERQSGTTRALHGLLKALAFVPNLLLAAVGGSLLAAPISLLLFRVLPSNVAAYAQNVTTLVPAFGLGYGVARKFHHSVARWIWIPAAVLWLLIVLPTLASYTGLHCDLSRSQYFVREFLFNVRTDCDEGLAWPLYTLPTLCCIGYSLGAKLAAHLHPENLE